MKICLTFLFCFYSTLILAQNQLTVDVEYENLGSYVVTGQTGNVTITINNNNPIPVNVRLAKSINIFEEPYGLNPMVQFIEDFSPLPGEPCQWHLSAYSPWPSNTDGHLLQLHVENMPANSTVVCTGTYEVFLTTGSHEVSWSLFINDNFVTEYSQNFILGLLPVPRTVNTLNTSMLVLLSLVLLIVAMHRIKNMN